MVSTRGGGGGDEDEEVGVKGVKGLPIDVPPVNPAVAVGPVPEVTRRLRIQDIKRERTSDDWGAKRRTSEVMEREWTRKWTRVKRFVSSPEYAPVVCMWCVGLFDLVKG